MSELKNALRSGDIWVLGSRQFREFDEYLLTRDDYAQRVRESRLGLDVHIQCREYLEERLARLRESIAETESLAAADELPDAQISAAGLKIALLVNGPLRGGPVGRWIGSPSSDCGSVGFRNAGRSLQGLIHGVPDNRSSPARTSATRSTLDPPRPDQGELTTSDSRS